MRKIIVTIVAAIICIAGFAQKTDSLKIKKDSSLRVMMHRDSVKIEKEYAEMERWEKLKASSLLPVFSAGDFSGVVPVKYPTEMPDPKAEYKLLFEFTDNNPDSVIKEMNDGLVEVARTINLHVASGVPVNKIIPVIVVYAGMH